MDYVLRIGILLFIFGAAYLIRRYAARKVAQRRLTTILTVPPLPETMPAWADADHIAFVKRQIAALRRVPWGEKAERDSQAAHALYEQGLAVTYSAGGEFNKLTDAVDAFVRCPKPLALTGAADVILRLSYLRGTQYIPQGVQEAIGYTTQALQLNPKLVDAWLVRVRVLSLYEGRTALGLMKLALDEARKLAPNSPRLAMAESSYFRRIGNSELRIAALWRALAAAADGQLTPPERMSALDGVAWELMSAGTLDEAIRAYDQLNTEFPESAWGWHNASVAYDKAGRLAEALERSERALSFFEFGNARLRNNIIRLKLGAPVSAITNPQNEDQRDAAVEARVEYANWLKKQGQDRWNDAEQQFLLALQLAPDSAATHYQHGLFYEDAQRLDLARAAYMDAIRLDPERSGYRFRLAGVLTRLGPDYAPAAEAEYRTLLAHNDRAYDTHREYGRLLLSLGPAWWDEAEREIRRALELSPKDVGGNQLLVQLLDARRGAKAAME
jgi:tetratricopeptide (TPR) repeat protein